MPKRSLITGPSSPVENLLRNALELQRHRASQQSLHGTQDDSPDLDSLPSDLMSSISCLRSQMMARPKTPTEASAPPRPPPVILRTQLRSMLKDSTELERELDGLRRSNVIRVVMINTGECQAYGSRLTYMCRYAYVSQCLLCKDMSKSRSTFDIATISIVVVVKPSAYMLSHTNCCRTERASPDLDHRLRQDLETRLSRTRCHRYPP